MKKALSFLTFLLFAITATHTAVGQTFTITSSDRGHISLHFDLGDFRIDTVRDLVPASLYGEDYSGECYTVVIRGEERRLFFERSSGRQPNRFGRWFVEC